MSKKILKDFDEGWGDADFPLLFDVEMRRTDNWHEIGIHPNYVIATTTDQNWYSMGFHIQSLKKMCNEDDDSSNDGRTLQDEPLSQLTIQMIDPDNLRRQTLVPPNDNLREDPIVNHERYNNNKLGHFHWLALDTFEFLQCVMGFDDEEDENNNYRGGDTSIDDVIKHE